MAAASVLGTRLGRRLHDGVVGAGEDDAFPRPGKELPAPCRGFYDQTCTYGSRLLLLVYVAQRVPRNEMVFSMAGLPGVTQEYTLEGMY